MYICTYICTLTYNHRQSVEYCQQDFVVNTHRDFFCLDKGLFYWPNHSWETRVSKQDEDVFSSLPMKPQNGIGLRFCDDSWPV